MRLLSRDASHGLRARRSGAGLAELSTSPPWLTGGRGTPLVMRISMMALGAQGPATRTAIGSCVLVQDGFRMAGWCCASCEEEGCHDSGRESCLLSLAEKATRCRPNKERERPCRQSR